MDDIRQLRALAQAAAAECEDEGDWFDPDLIESSAPVFSSPAARRFVAAMTPHMALRLLAGCVPMQTQEVKS